MGKKISIFCGAILVAITAVLVLVVSGLRENLGKADIALVLGNKVELDGTPSPRLKARLDKTIEMYRAGYFPKILVSGGIGKEGYDEAEIMRDYLVNHGIPSGIIMVDNCGTNTAASAKKTLEICHQYNIKSVFIITQYFHIPRCYLALRQLGITEVYSASADFFEVRDIYSIGREFIAYIAYYLK